MTISTSIDFSVTRDDIITEALELLGVLGEGETPNASQLTSSARTLNLMVKAWQSRGFNIFATQRIYFFPQKATNEYLTSTWNATTAYTKTEVATAGVATDTTVVVDSITGISDEDIIGIELDSGSWHWTTVSGAPAGSTVTITDALPSAVAVNNYVIAYTTTAKRPMKLEEVVRRDLVSGSDTPLTDILTRNQYLALSPKTTDGAITSIYYDPQIGTGKLYIWPETDTIRKILVLYVQKTLADLDSSSDNPEYPQEWYLALTYNLAELLMPKYGTDAKRAQLIIKNAQFFREEAESFDVEDTVHFHPEIRSK
jgi:hypothetical protein